MYPLKTLQDIKVFKESGMQSARQIRFIKRGLIGKTIFNIILYWVEIMSVVSLSNNN